MTDFLPRFFGAVLSPSCTCAGPLPSASEPSKPAVLFRFGGILRLLWSKLQRS